MRWARRAIEAPVLLRPRRGQLRHGGGQESALTDSKSLLFRVEAFNVFNHTQFNGPGSVDGNIGSSTFGNAISAAPPRILQGALKFNF
jgi:hypothetical protein